MAGSYGKSRTKFHKFLWIPFLQEFDYHNKYYFLFNCFRSLAILCLKEIIFDLWHLNEITFPKKKLKAFLIFKITNKWCVPLFLQKLSVKLTEMEYFQYLFFSKSLLAQPATNILITRLDSLKNAVTVRHILLFSLREEGGAMMLIWMLEEKGGFRLSHEIYKWHIKKGEGRCIWTTNGLKRWKWESVL